MSWYSYLDIGHVFAQPRYDGGDNQVVDVAGNHAGDPHYLEAVAAWHQVPWKLPLTFTEFQVSYHWCRKKTFCPSSGCSLQYCGLSWAALSTWIKAWCGKNLLHEKYVKKYWYVQLLPPECKLLWEIFTLGLYPQFYRILQMHFVPQSLWHKVCSEYCKRF